MCVNHVHLCLNVPPKYSISEVMGYIKGRSAPMIFDKYPEYRTKWNKEFWATGYYVSTVGDLSEGAVKEYIKEQEESDLQQDKR